MPPSKTIILLFFAFLWIISLFVIAIGSSQERIELDYDYSIVHSFVNLISDIYHLIPSNIIVVVAVISMLFVTRFLFKL